MTEFVLDASALLALLRAEPGGDRVGNALADSAITAVNFAEVVGHYARNGGQDAEIHAILDPLPISLVPFDDELAYHVGLLLPMTRPAGLSLGDRACLALARRLDVPALTADRAWQAIAAQLGVRVELIR
jgi:PIN domain nuclease of toxin-antitoxin system